MIRRAHEFDLATDNGPVCRACECTVYAYTIDRDSNTFRAECMACGERGPAISYGPAVPCTGAEARAMHVKAHGILYGWGA